MPITRARRNINLGIESLESRQLLAIDLVADLNQRGGGSNPTALVQLGEEYFFAGVSQPGKYGLWNFDPASNTSTAVLEDISVQTFSREEPFWVANDLLFFTVRKRAPNQVTTYELWVSDGTPSGTSFLTTGRFTPLLATDSALYFTGQYGFWKSDGTAEGTANLLSDGRLTAGPFELDGGIVIGVQITKTGEHELRIIDESLAGTNNTFSTLLSDGRLIAGPFELNGSIVIGVQNTETGQYELRIIDESLAGTNTFATNTWVHPQPSPVVANGKLYFSSQTNEFGRELWVTDGTTAGTRMVRDIVPGPDTAIIDNLHVSENETVFFSAFTPETGIELWRTEGTEATTRLLADIATDVASSTPHNFWNNGDTTYFAATTPAAGTEIWATDGTAEGTRLVQETIPGIYSRTFSALGNIGKQVALLVNWHELWTTDGTMEGTQRIAEFSQRVNETFYINEHLVFAADDRTGSGNELWITDGTQSGTYMIDIAPGPDSSWSRSFQKIDDRLFFTAQVGSGRERFVSDLTVAGTRQLETLNPNPATRGSDARPLGRLPNGTVITLADDGGEMGHELWAVDPKGNSTLLRDFTPGEGSTSIYGQVAILNERMFLRIGGRLWSTDGTPNNTRQVGELTATGNRESFTVVGDKLFFVTWFENTEWLAVTDGTSAGTQLVKRLGDVEYFEMEEFIGQLAFKARDELHGTELWITDGSPEGTRLVKDVLAGPGESSILSLRVVQGRLYFAAFDGESNSDKRTLWTSDGTTEGTVRLLDQPTYDLFAGEKLLYFTSDDSVHGREIWRTDGTALGTFMVRDINRSGSSSNHLVIFEVAGVTYFLADEGFGDGRQYWKTRGTPFDTEKVFGPIADSNNAVSPWDGKFLLRNGNRFFQSDGTSEGTHELPAPPYTVTEFGPQTAVAGGFLVGAFTVELGNELFLITPLEQSNPQVVRFDHNESNGAASIIESVSFTFNSDVSASVTVNDLLITSEMTRGRSIDVSATTFTWDAVSNTVTWDLSTLELGYGLYNFEIGRRGLYDRNNNRLDGNADGVNGDSFRTTVSTALAGDIDLNGGVDFADFLVLSANFGTSNLDWSEGDLNGDSAVNFADFLLLSNNFGRTSAQASKATAATFATEDDDWWSL